MAMEFTGFMLLQAQEVSSEGKRVLGVNKSYIAATGGLNWKRFPLTRGALLSLMQTVLFLFYRVQSAKMTSGKQRHGF